MPLWDSFQKKSLRIGIALYLLIYHLSFLSVAHELWGEGRMIDRKLILPHLQSLLFLSRHDIWVDVVLGLLLVLSLCMLFMELNAIWLSLLFVLHLSLINANPTLVHEPHQIVQLMILVLILQKRQDDSMIAKIWTFGVFFYYFMSGLKKLPDPQWLSGSALTHLISWSGLSLGNVFTKSFLSLPTFIQMCANYFTLALELSAPLAFFKPKFRSYWIGSALVMHGAIFLTLDVGYFSLVMPVALLSCADQATRKILWPLKGRAS